MHYKQYSWLSFWIILLLVAIGGLFLRHKLETQQKTETQMPGNVSSSTALGNGISITGLPAGATVHILQNVTLPSLTQQVTYSSTLSTDIVTQLQTQIAQLRAQLKTNPSNTQNWLQLAIDYKEAGDYVAAANVWTYLTQALPSNYIAFADLGDLYTNFLIDYPKAETNYLAAIKLNPSNIDLYNNLYMLYRYKENNPTAAAAILAQGLKANPGNATLLQLQSQLQSGQ